jgi:hypothetical protein
MAPFSKSGGLAVVLIIWLIDLADYPACGEKSKTDISSGLNCIRKDFWGGDPPAVAF